MGRRAQAKPEQMGTGIDKDVLPNSEETLTQVQDDLMSLAGSSIAGASQDGFGLFGEDSVSSFSLFEPKSEPNYERSFFIMKNESISGQIFSLPHPKSGNPALYLIDEHSNPHELLRFDQGKRSFFYGDSVVSDGSITMFFPVHPLFLAFENLHKKGNDHFETLSELLDDPLFPGLSKLCKSEKLMEALKLASDWKENENEPTLFRYNEERIFNWLDGRFQILKNSMASNQNDENTSDEQCFGILSDYLPEFMSNLLKIRLDIKVDEKDNIARGKKREAGKIETRIKNMATPAKKLKKKIFAETSKGTPSLTSFFTSLNSKKEQE